ncbi:MAG: hypothetical protein EOP51_03740 [Sphingobacteriales bacterium]|nr:MAG: hypothetical protein EOP51_03740 [Sphingobacteriales bacterium]
MKQVIMLLITGLFLSSCSNSKTYCWVCTTDTTYNAGSFMGQTVYTGKSSVCGKTKNEIRDIENRDNRQFDENNIHKSMITVCEKQ